MVGNPVQFAVVREDPELEAELVPRFGGEGRALLVASGGCTALTLRSRFPRLALRLIDPNPAQLELVRRKLAALGGGGASAAAFGVGAEGELTSCGNFESLFRCFRNFVHELVLPREGWLSFFDAPSTSALARIAASPYWAAAFEMHFHDSLLLAMFGPDAVQHAPPGSYPAHFRRALEGGLARADAGANYFLHHIFLGHYLQGREPAYLRGSQLGPAPELTGERADEVSYSGYSLVSLSNIFDWMSEEEVGRVAAKVARELSPGAWLVFRQLNHAKDFRPGFGPGLRFDPELGSALHARDRSLFYSSVHVARKVSP
jgi:S-adenosylmethionine-diacylglycerol 3-amino-3-carboxypropyl transferase